MVKIIGPVALSRTCHFYKIEKICSCINQGNATMESEDDAKVRKIQFSQCRHSFQAFRINLLEGIFDKADAYGHVVITKKSDLDVYEEVAKLYIQLEPPPRPPTPTPSPVPSPPPDEARVPSPSSPGQPASIALDRPISAAAKRIKELIENRRTWNTFLYLFCFQYRDQCTM